MSMILHTALGLSLIWKFLTGKAVTGYTKTTVPAWEQVGTTSLIISALKKQENLTKSRYFEEFICERAEWILSKREQDGGWEHISTSNLIIQALLLTGFKKEVEISINWLIGKVRESGAWGNKEDDINATALTLTTLGMYERS